VAIVVVTRSVYLRVDFALIGQRTGRPPPNGQADLFQIWMPFLESGRAVQWPCVIRGFPATAESSSRFLRRL
jgi:hypothetical protein